MLAPEPSREGWTPGAEVPVADVVEHAFDYRGDITIERADAPTLVGYVFNRDAEAAEPYLQLLPPDGGGPVTVRYRDVRAIHFTGKDTAAGTSYAAWLRRREALRSGVSTSA